MDMTTAPDFGGPGFGHESHALTELAGELLDSLFEHDVHVCHLQRFSVPKIDFVLPTTPLALARLHRHSGGAHLVAQGPHERLILRGLHYVIVNPVIAGGSQVAVFRRMRL